MASATGPSWVRISHAVLQHGAKLSSRELRQGPFWSLVPGRRPGTLGISKNTGTRAVADREKLGRYLLRDELRFGPGMGLVVAVAVGSESLRAVLVDANGVLCRRSDGSLIAEEKPPRPGQCLLDPTELADRIARAVGRVVGAALEEPHLLVRDHLPLLGVALSWPSSLSREQKVPVGGAFSHAGWTGGDSGGVRGLLADRQGLRLDRVHAINNANALALAESFDRCRAEPPRGDDPGWGGSGETLLSLHLGSSVGAGIVAHAVSDDPSRSRFLQSRLLEGSRGVAGELGHWQVPAADIREIFREDRREGLADPPEFPCSCGRTTCLNSFAGTPAFLARMRRSGITIPGVRDDDKRAQGSIVPDALRDLRDPRQLRALRDIGELIGRALAAPVLLVDPVALSLGGSLALPEVARGLEHGYEHWQNPVVISMEEAVQPRLPSGPESRYSSARGAALVALRGRVFRRLDEFGADERALRELTEPVSRPFVESALGSGMLRPKPKRDRGGPVSRAARRAADVMRGG